MRMLGRIYKGDYRAGSLKDEQNFSRLKVGKIGVRYQSGGGGGVWGEGRNEPRQRQSARLFRER